MAPQEKNMSWSKEKKAEYARDYRKDPTNNDRINKLRRETNKEKRIFFINLFGGKCQLCKKDIKDDEKYVVHHLNYKEDVEKFGKRIAPFSRPTYIANHKKNFLLLHQRCHYALHVIIELPIENILEIKKRLESIEEKR